MADRATQSLAHIKESGEYVLVPDFVVFDEHDEYDLNGKLIRRFDRTKLQQIVDACKARQENTGDLAVIAPGHSLDNPKSEEDQPPPWGYGADWKLGNFGPEQKLGAICNAYIRKTITTKDGKQVDGPEYVQSFPRRSPEVWPNHPSIPEHARNSIDWIAVLRRAPQRDLGLSVYSRSYSAAQEPISATTPLGKLRYQMETPMADPVQEPRTDLNPNLDAGDTEGGDASGIPEGHEQWASHMDYAMGNHPQLKQLGALCKKYGMDEAALGATNAALPGADEESSVMQNQLTPAATPDAQKTKYQRQLDAQELRIAAHEAELAIERKRLKIQRYEMALKDLSEEYEIDIAVELEDCVGLDDKGFDKHIARIKRSYSRTPVGGDLPHEALEQPAEAKKLDDPEVEIKIHRYMRDNPEFVQKHGERAFKEAARVLKFIA